MRRLLLLLSGVLLVSACPSGEEFRDVEGLRWNDCVLELCFTRGEELRCVACDSLSTGIFSGTGPASCEPAALKGFVVDATPPQAPSQCLGADTTGDVEEDLTDVADVADAEVVVADVGPELVADLPAELDVPAETGDETDGAGEVDAQPDVDALEVSDATDGGDPDAGCADDCEALAPPCMVGSCDGQTCVFTEATDGSACDDGDLCTTGDSCESGTCEPGTPTTCDASAACTATSACDPGTGTCVDTSEPDETPCGAFGAPAFCGSGQCWPRRVTAGWGFMCLLTAGDVVCWGQNSDGQLGRGHQDYVGDDEPLSVGAEALSGKQIVQIDAGFEHTCGAALNGDVRCWGKGLNGQLGLGNVDSLGDDEQAFTEDPVDLGPLSNVEAAYAFLRSSCALVNSELRCWGANDDGVVGTGTLNVIGDDESPVLAPATDVGGPIARVYAGVGSQVCVRLENGTHRCWGFTPFFLGNDEMVFGDDESALEAPLADINFAATQLSLGSTHGCARDSTGWLRCFGAIAQVGVGYGNGSNSSIGALEDLGIIGGVLTKSVATGLQGTCAILQDNRVRCWGAWTDETGGLSITGFDSAAAQGPLWEFSSPPQQLAVGETVACAVLANGDVMCWGNNSSGQLGLGHTDPVANTPAQGPVLLPWK